MVPETVEPQHNRPNATPSRQSPDDRWFAPGDPVSLVPRRTRKPNHAAGPADVTAEGEKGIVVEIFDDARAPLAYVRFRDSGSRWVFAEDLRHAASSIRTT